MRSSGQGRRHVTRKQHTIDESLKSSKAAAFPDLGQRLKLGAIQPDRPGWRQPTVPDGPTQQSVAKRLEVSWAWAGHAQDDAAVAQCGSHALQVIACGQPDDMG